MKELVITKSITKRDEISIARYLKDISKFEVLSPEQETELFKRYQDGEQYVLEKILSHNLRFVVSVAKQYQNSGLGLNDLINEGNLGLIIAAKRFDISRGFKFISYAVWWIRQSILQALNEKGRNIRLPINQITSYQKIIRCEKKLYQVLGRAPLDEEIASKMELSANYITSVIQSSQFSISLDAPSMVDEDYDIKSFMLDEKTQNTDAHLENEESLQIEVKQLLGLLPEREQKILILFFGIGQKNTLSIESIGEEFDLSPERIRQIKFKALRKIRFHVKRRNLTF